jgi:drug/metabolite transporter (DMT)-like permease
VYFLAVISRALKAELLLLIAAAIWGFAFTAQRAGMAHLGPFTFNAIRFALGALVLLPWLLASGRLRARRPGGAAPAAGAAGAGGTIPAGEAAVAITPGPGLMPTAALAGIVLFGGASLQQAGIVTTSASKAGFITGMYVVMVPLLGLIWRQRPGAGTWLGALLCAVGLALLSLKQDLRPAPGDLLVLLGAVLWALHTLLLGWAARRHDPIVLAMLQFAVCALLSAGVAAAGERVNLAGLCGAAGALLFSGVLSVGVAYTLQVVAQRQAPPAHAAIILSLEAVFAAVGGALFLGERLTGRELAGCGLMLAGMLAAKRPARPT